MMAFRALFTILNYPHLVVAPKGRLSPLQEVEQGDHRPPKFYVYYTAHVMTTKPSVRLAVKPCRTVHCDHYSCHSVIITAITL